VEYSTFTASAKFLYIDPLKQGLKQSQWEKMANVFNMFLYIDPLKQGLKQNIVLSSLYSLMNVFIHRSIKTRIETSIKSQIRGQRGCFYT